MKYSRNLPTDHPSKLNVQAIAKLEEEALARRSGTHKFSDAIVKTVGSTYFLFLNLALVQTFDPHPFGLLALVVSSEGVLLPFFLISQNRMARAAERRSHLDLQVGIWAEQELTTILQILHTLCTHAGADVGASSEQVEDFKNATDARKLATELDDKLPEG